MLDNPNEFSNTSEFGKAYAVNRLLFGDAYVYMLRGIGLSEGRIKEMALSAFTESELNPVRNEWESKFIGKVIDGVYFESDGCIYVGGVVMRKFLRIILVNEDVVLFPIEEVVGAVS